MIGTHNSTAYRIDYSVKLSEGKWETLRKLARYIPPIRNKITKLTKTQNLDLRQQFDAGVRLFSIYVSCTKDGFFYCSHTFATIPLSEALEALSSCSEPCSVLLRPDPNNYESVRPHEVKLLELIKELTHITWYYESIGMPKLYPNVRPSYEIKIDWYNVDNPAGFLERFKSARYDHSERLTGLGCTLTPQNNASIIFQDLEKNARSLNPAIRKKIQELPEGERPYIVTFDYVEL